MKDDTNRKDEVMEYVIWSNEHNQWWRADSRGYCDYVKDAGSYTIEEALEICNGANHGWDVDLKKSIPNELPIPRYVAEQLIYRNHINDQ